MVSLAERLKARIRGRSENAPAPAVSAATPPEPSPRREENGRPDATEGEEATEQHSSSILQRLWDGAYAKAQKNEEKLVESYEKILAALLKEDEGQLSDLAVPEDALAQEAEKRRAQMRKLVDIGLEKTEKDAKVKERLGNSIKTVQAVKGVVDKAIQASPQAALAWVGACFALDILMNPVTQNSSNRQGIIYVLSRMEWYWGLAALLAEESLTTPSSSAQQQLEKNIINLYSKLLVHQMKTICSHQRGRFAVFARDLIKLDNWDGGLKDLQSAETAFQADSLQYNTSASRASLASIAKAAEEHSAQLDGVSLAIHDQTRQQRRLHESSADKKCLADLRLSDPRDDKKRIEETKGGLLEDVYRWILRNPDYLTWRDNERNRLLWIRGDPGKGKTMLMCGIINELEQSLDTASTLSYFFCQATDSRLNSAMAVLRGLVYCLASQQPKFMPKIRERYDEAGKLLFEDINAWTALTGILENMLQESECGGIYLIIDGLDECVTDLPKLLKFITKMSSTTKAKWIVSSRNWHRIQEQLEQPRDGLSLSLELNASSISNAVEVFTKDRVQKLAERKAYKTDLQDAIFERLIQNADNTFLWVALVCQMLEDVAPRNVLKKINETPQQLDDLYRLMLKQVVELDDDAETCRQILATTLVTFRPLTTIELASLVDSLEEFLDDIETLEEIISLCGSFLTIRQDTVYFVHQSAKDYLLDRGADRVFASTEADIHYKIVCKSLLYWVERPDPDPLSSIQYACVRWIDHLCELPFDTPDYKSLLADGGAVDVFIRKSYLYWLEALSLTSSMSGGPRMVIKLCQLIQAVQPESRISHIVDDARSFIMAHHPAIEMAPFQAYVSALLFSPSTSAIKQLFESDRPEYIQIGPQSMVEWGGWTQSFNNGYSLVRSVTFSRCSRYVASGSSDKTVSIWDLRQNERKTILEGHESWINSACFSPNSNMLASGSEDGSIKIWDTETGECLRTLSLGCPVSHVDVSHDSRLLASASEKGAEIWQIEGGQRLHSLSTSDSHCVKFSDDSRQLVSSTSDAAYLWETKTGDLLRVFQGDPRLGPFAPVAFSPDGSPVAFSSDGPLVAAALWDMIVLWRAGDGEVSTVLIGHTDCVRSLVVLCDGKFLLSSSADMTIRLWDLSSGVCVKILTGHTSWVTSLSLSADKKSLASGSHDCTLKIWSIDNLIGSGVYPWRARPDSHGAPVTDVASYSGGQTMAISSKDGNVRLWNMRADLCEQVLDANDGSDDNGVANAVFSQDGSFLATTSANEVFKLWRREDGVYLCKHTIYPEAFKFQIFGFSNNLKLLLGASLELGPQIWCTETGTEVATLLPLAGGTLHACFSPDSTALLAIDGEKTLTIWDLETLEEVMSLRTLTDLRRAAFLSCPDLLVAQVGPFTIEIWNLANNRVVHMFDMVGKATKMGFDCDSCQIWTNLGSIPVGADDMRRWSAEDAKGPDIETWLEDDSEANAEQGSRSVHGEEAGLKNNAEPVDACEAYLEASSDAKEDLREAGSHGRSEMSLSEADERLYPYRGLWLDTFNWWIMRDQEALVMIPPEFRGEIGEVRDNSVILAYSIGKFWICTIT